MGTIKSGIRFATENDDKEIRKIYAPYVRETAISFETEVPSEEEMRERISVTLKQYPYLVYVENGSVRGYAYASKHRERAAYCYDADVSVYIDSGWQSKGVGSLLYDRLFRLLAERGYVNAYAGITLPNEKSCHLHEKFGFTPVGVYRKTGYKFGKWHDVLWMEKRLQNTDIPPELLDM